MNGKNINNDENGGLMLSVENINKSYSTNEGEVPVLKNLSFKMVKGEFLVIIGPSGSGKTTLLNIISGFLKADSGRVVLNKSNLLEMNEDAIAVIRQKQMGFVFQDFMLLEGLTVRENILLPQIIAGKKNDQIDSHTDKLLATFGLVPIKNSYPPQTSGGQQQRTSIARALSNNPAIVLADEPTGNLDSKSSSAVITSFINAKEKFGASIFMVTHDMFAASYADRVIVLRDGEISTEFIRKSEPKVFFETLLEFTRKDNGDRYDI